MTIAVEFDGTIVENNYPFIGKEIPMALFILKELQNRGHKIILWTNRNGEELKDAINFCIQHDLNFNAVNENIVNEGDNDESRQGRKIDADIYIDARNLGGLRDWNDIFWKLHPDELNYIKLIKMPKKEGFLKKIFLNMRSKVKKL